VLDPLASVIVGLLIIKVAYVLLSRGIGDLTEHSLPDSVEDEILALISTLPGIDKPHVCTAPEVILGGVRPKGKKAVVIGSGMTGLETAEFLLQDGCDTTIIEMAPEIAPGTWFQLVDDEMERLVPAGCKFKAGTKLLEIGDGTVSVEDVKSGARSTIPAEAVVLSMGVRPVPDLEEDLKARGLRVVRVGDAVKSGTIANAVHSAYDTALTV
jgi:NADPH-dependent 2,4-dienoyl-CoA reductase/sulfur reductase-like enzyme